MKKYMACIPSSGPLWRRIPPSPKNVMDFAALAPTTIDSTPTKMADKLKLKNPLEYHSHSLRRTGATLLAMAGKTEEQIKTMGNWSSASAVIRYIENSEVSMRRNDKAIVLPEFILPDFKDSTVSVLPVDTTPVQKSASPIVTEPDAIVLSADSSEQKLDQCVEPTPAVDSGDDAHPPPTKKHEGIVFAGSINQVNALRSLDPASITRK